MSFCAVFFILKLNISDTEYEYCASLSSKVPHLLKHSTDLLDLKEETQTLLWPLLWRVYSQ